MTTRSALYEPAVIRFEGRQQRAARTYCGRCSFNETLSINTMKGTDDGRETQIIASKFQKKGWKWGNSASAHRCPACFAAVRNARKSHSMSNERSVVELRAVPANEAITKASDRLAASLEAPKPQDRRLIFLKIQEVYDDNQPGYRGDWSDKKIAADLSVSADWVREVREANFGPAGLSETARIQVAEARALLTEINAINEKVAGLMKSAERIGRALDSIEKDLR